MTEQSRTKIFLVDDHPLVRESLSNLINQQEDLVVCGEAEDAASALSAIRSIQPDVVVVDLSLKQGSGLDLIKSLKAHQSPAAVIVLSMHDERVYAERAVRAGARGYVMKRESTTRIVWAIRQVMQGRLAVSDQIAAVFAERFVGNRPGQDDAPMESLSDRELQVFQLLGNGMETRQIAEVLNVSMKTVQVYCARIKVKLNIANATELLTEAVRWHERQQAGVA
ncbi:MAG TPA: response regulator transcription factor [Rhizomicrobium sp.]|jgi:DNA-binding NarL/FixJ family response regulator|nr:response regulator transcription factor [Rhizomicrobium sp.]